MVVVFADHTTSEDHRVLQLATLPGRTTLDDRRPWVPGESGCYGSDLCMSQRELKALLSSVESRTRTRSGKAGLSMDEEVTRLKAELAAARRASEETDEELRGLRSALQQAKSDVEEAQAEART